MGNKRIRRENNFFLRKSSKEGRTGTMEETFADLVPVQMPVTGPGSNRGREGRRESSKWEKGGRGRGWRRGGGGIVHSSKNHLAPS